MSNRARPLEWERRYFVTGVCWAEFLFKCVEDGNRGLKKGVVKAARPRTTNTCECPPPGCNIFGQAPAGAAFMEFEGLHFNGSEIIYSIDYNMLLLMAPHLILCQLNVASLKGLFYALSFFYYINDITRTSSLLIIYIICWRCQYFSIPWKFTLSNSNTLSRNIQSIHNPHGLNAINCPLILIKHTLLIL